MARKVLSIVAKPPDPAPGKPNKLRDSVVKGDGNRGIDDILSNMTAAIVRGGLGYEPFLERATYARDIAIKLDEFRDHNGGQPPDVLQIVGHGSPGRIELGQYWTRTPYDPDNGHSVLDSSPDSYGVLNERLRPGSIVLLVGCFAGSTENGGGVANGPALLYDIEQMGKVHVYASDGKVNPNDFQDGFLYAGSLSASNGQPANPLAILRDRTSMEVLGGPSPLIFEKVLCAPVLGLFGSNQPALRIPPQLQKLLNKSYQEVQPDQKLLAMTELEVKVKGFSEPAQFICAGRYVRILDGMQTRYFAEQAAPDARRARWQMISKRLSEAVLLKNNAIADI